MGVREFWSAAPPFGKVAYAVKVFYIKEIEEGETLDKLGKEEP